MKRKGGGAKHPVRRVQDMRERRRAAGACLDCGGAIEDWLSVAGDKPKNKRRRVRCRRCADRNRYQKAASNIL